jgi:lipid II isoglutaminyl synthase (glutamine-hydrolysing)
MYSKINLIWVVFKIKFKSLLSIIVSKITLKLSRLVFKGGSNFPGKIALKLDRNILSIVARDYKIILVTGTNGKTTTTSMIYNILKSSNKKVISNGTGANMLPGIVSCFIDNFCFRPKSEESFAVIEVDEANVKFITEHITPSIITITNLFRDQLDRYGEVYTTLNKILEGVKKVNQTTLVLNGDESLLGSLQLPNKTVYYGFDTSFNNNVHVEINADAKFCIKCKAPYSYNFITYNHLGNFFCPSCGYKRPELKYFVDEIIDLTPDSSTININGESYSLNQSGIYNIYNALCAYSIAKELELDNTIIYNSLKSQSSHFGRQEALNINGKQVKIILVKNPAGYNQAIDTVALDKRNLSIAFLLNDNYADGRDISWIWDVNFEKLINSNIEDIFIAGIRLYDMACRLKIAGLNPSKFKLGENFEELLGKINKSESSTVYILATYTAMINFRKFLYNKGYIEKLW